MTSTSSKPNTAFGIIATIAILWNLMGVAQFFMQAMNTETFRAQYTAEELLVIDSLPLYYIVIFAIAVFASLLGSAFLIARRKQAVPFFLIGLFAVLLQTSYNLFINDGRSEYGPFQYTMLIVIPAAAALLYWYSRDCDKKGWLM